MVNYGKIEVEISGLTPLLMNRMNVDSLKDSGATSRNKEYVPKDMARKAAYLTDIDGKEELFVPSYAVYSMLIRAAAAYKFPKRRSSMSGYLAGTIRIEPEKLLLGTNEYEIDERSVVIQRSRVLAWRPKIKDWKLTFTIIYNKFALPNNVIPQLETMLNDGGTRLGLLDYRPQHKGWFGTFEVTKFKIVD